MKEEPKQVPQESFEVPECITHIEHITNWEERIATYDNERQSN